MLRNPLPVLNRSILICPFPASSTLTQNTLLRTLEKLLEINFTITQVDVDKIHRNALAVLEKWKEEGEKEEGKAKMGQAMKGLAVSNQFYEGNTVKPLGHFAEDNDIVGVEIVDVEDAVRDALERYGKECQVVKGMFEVEACEV
jgi:hypothetical protein